jgi:type IV pilus assembly protein PilN
MATINLRPWREERRERLKKEFVQVIGLFAFAAVAIWFAWNLAVNSLVSHQQTRNKLLETEIVSLDKKAKEIRDLKAKKVDLVDRMKVIQGLQGTRPIIVHLFDELAKTVPDGVYYKSIVRTGMKISVEGAAESNQRVSTLMRNIDESEWFANPNLTKVQANTSLGEQGNDFFVTFDISTPESNEVK